MADRRKARTGARFDKFPGICYDNKRKTRCKRKTGAHIAAGKSTPSPFAFNRRFFLMKKLFLLLCLLVMLLPCAALGENAEIAALAPAAMTPDAESQILDLYCGPTQGFYRHGAQTLDTGKPYVIFGQYDCWAMAAQGTADAFGPVGWVEAGFIADIPYEPQLAFEDGFAAVVEEPAAVTDNPMADDPFSGWAVQLAPGTDITVLAACGDWLYVQCEFENTPARVFIPASAIE